MIQAHNWEVTMKKILFLVREYEDDVQLFVKEAQNQGVELVVATYPEVIVEFKDNDSYFSIRDEYSLKEFDIVYFRNVGEHLEMHFLICQACRELGIPVIDPVLQYNRPWVDRKSFEYMRLAEQDLPIINSYVTHADTFHYVRPNLEYPVVAKVTDGKWGEGVYLCQFEAEVVFLLEKYNAPLLIQEYIENDGDIRIIVIDDAAIGAIKRVRTVEDEFRNNVALGGEASVIEIDDDLARLAVRAAQALDYKIAGIDAVYCNDCKEWKIIEVNRGPKFAGFMEATGIDIPQIIIAFLLKQLA